MYSLKLKKKKRNILQYYNYKIKINKNEKDIFISI